MSNLPLKNLSYSPLSKEIQDKVKSEMGFVPNMYASMGYNAALLDAYSYAYKSFRANSGFTPIEQEVIFLSVAYENNCTYCMAAHSFVADKMSGVPHEITDAIREGKEIPDAKLLSLSRLTRLLTANRGLVERGEIEKFLAAGYTEAAVLGVIAGIGVKTLSNYANHQTSPELDAVFTGRSWHK